MQQPPTYCVSLGVSLTDEHLIIRPQPHFRHGVDGPQLVRLTLNTYNNNGKFDIQRNQTFSLTRQMFRKDSWQWGTFMF